MFASMLPSYIGISIACFIILGTFFMNFARHIQKVTITEGISITVGHEVELFDPKMDTGH